MQGILFIARLLLAAIFAVAGAAKLADRQGARRAAIDFGIPGAAAGAVALLLPATEIAVAAALLFDRSATAGAVCALGLLTLFSAAILGNLARGRKPDCHCFGRVHSSPVGWKTLARNVALSAAAAFVAWGGPGDAGDAVGWIGGLRTGEAVALGGVVVLAALATLGGWMQWQLMRQNGRLMMRLDALQSALGLRIDPSANGLPVGAPAPEFALLDATGETVRLDALLALGRPVLLVFTSSDCEPCAALTQRDEDAGRPHIPGVRHHEGTRRVEFTKSSRSRGQGHALILTVRGRATQTMANRDFNPPAVDSFSTPLRRRRGVAGRRTLGSPGRPEHGRRRCQLDRQGLHRFSVNLRSPIRRPNRRSPAGAVPTMLPSQPRYLDPPGTTHSGISQSSNSS